MGLRSGKGIRICSGLQKTAEGSNEEFKEGLGQRPNLRLGDIGQETQKVPFGCRGDVETLSQRDTK